MRQAYMRQAYECTAADRLDTADRKKGWDEWAQPVTWFKGVVCRLGAMTRASESPGYRSAA
jgi:hypothetical protein